jgi:hypothetical protein
MEIDINNIVGTLNPLIKYTIESYYFEKKKPNFGPLSMK